MKVYEIRFDVEGSGGEIKTEVMFISAPDLAVACTEANLHACEYGKELTSVRYAITVVQRIPQQEQSDGKQQT